MHRIELIINQSIDIDERRNEEKIRPLSTRPMRFWCLFSVLLFVFDKVIWNVQRKRRVKFRHNPKQRERNRKAHTHTRAKSIAKNRLTGTGESKRRGRRYKKKGKTTAKTMSDRWLRTKRSALFLFSLGYFKKMHLSLESKDSPFKIT